MGTSIKTVCIPAQTDVADPSTIFNNVEALYQMHFWYCNVNDFGICAQADKLHQPAAPPKVTPPLIPAPPGAPPTPPTPPLTPGMVEVVCVNKISGKKCQKKALRRLCYKNSVKKNCPYSCGLRCYGSDPPGYSPDVFG